MCGLPFDHPGKFLLAKMALRQCGCSLGWLHSTCKYDHSKRDANGEPLRWREKMHADSQVSAPPIFPVKEMRALIDAELRSPLLTIEEVDDDEHLDSVLPMPDRVNMQHEEHKGASLRDVQGALLRMIDRAHL